MPIKPGLLRYLLRQVRPQFLFLFVVMFGFLLAVEFGFMGTQMVPWLVFLFSWIAGRSWMGGRSEGALPFLFSRGLPRQVIWTHLLLAYVLLWLPASVLMLLILWLGPDKTPEWDDVFGAWAINKASITIPWLIVSPAAMAGSLFTSLRSLQPDRFREAFFRMFILLAASVIFLDSDRSSSQWLLIAWSLMAGCAFLFSCPSLLRTLEVK